MLLMNRKSLMSSLTWTLWCLCRPASLQACYERIFWVKLIICVTFEAKNRVNRYFLARIHICTTKYWPFSVVGKFWQDTTTTKNMYFIIQNFAITNKLDLHIPGSVSSWRQTCWWRFNWCFTTIQFIRIIYAVFYSVTLCKSIYTSTIITFVCIT